MPVRLEGLEVYEQDTRRRPTKSKLRTEKSGYRLAKREGAERFHHDGIQWSVAAQSQLAKSASEPKPSPPLPQNKDAAMVRHVTN
ncbi:unnamed protein product [Ceratitis capitata]|uniref:(Mediterranean fruit fly) hypothetical protein n=1 Tax=Ceratitis capitata TaxID=7213 RepID=A0A811UX37_CERCA|nr:unnamed protein product [Ceratitis capitata]